MRGEQRLQAGQQFLAVAMAGLPANLRDKRPVRRSERHHGAEQRRVDREDRRTGRQGAWGSGIRHASASR